MPYNGSGSFALPIPPSPFVTGTTISAPDMNTVLNDIATNGLTNAVTRDGQSPLTANWPVGGYNITGIGTASATTLNVSGTATIGTLAITTLSATTLTISGNGAIGGTLGVTGAITGSSTITAATGLTVSAGGATVTGNSTITGTLGGLTGLTMASGLITASSSGIKFSDNTTQTTAPVSYSPTGTASTAGKIVLPINSGAASIMIQWGRGTTDGSGVVTVTFGTAFSSTPRVTVSWTGSNANNNFANTEDVAAASFKGWTYDSGGSEVAGDFDWIAIGVA